MDKNNKKKIRYTRVGNRILSEPTEKVSEEYIKTEEFRDNVSIMLEVVKKEGLVGVAANQVSIPMRFAIVDVRPTATRPDLETLPTEVIINPEIIEKSEEKQYGWEGCLSLIGVFFFISRSKWIKVRYLNKEGEEIERKVEDREAKVFQHEIDHLDGVFCGEQVITSGDRVVRGGIITEDEYAKNPNQIPVGVKDMLDTD